VSSTAQGTGMLDVTAAAAAELVADPPALAFGRAARPGWTRERVVRVRNVSSRIVRVRVQIRVLGLAAAPATVRSRRRRLVLRPGATTAVRVVASVPRPAESGPAVEGSLVLRPLSGRTIRVPFAIPFAPPSTTLLHGIRLEPGSFEPSETEPAVLSLVAGGVRSTAGTDELQPVDRLDIELWTDDGERVGVVTRARNLLPGRFSFAITGHDPGGQELASGVYRLRILAFPAGGGPATRRSLEFTIE
jgi:hypothetical protein